RARFQASQWHVDKGQDLRKAGKLEEAMAEFQRAYALDAASTIAEQELRRTYEMLQREKKKKEQGQPAPKDEDRGLTPAAAARKDMEERVAGIQGVPELKPMGKIQNLRINNQPVKNLWDTVAKLAGITVIFDQDYLQQSTRNFSLEIQSAAIEEALDQVAVLTKAFWKPISANSIFVTQDQVTKRRDYEEQVVKTFYLQNVTSPQELQEVATVIRSVTDIRRLLTYNGQMAMTLRGSVDQVNLAQKIILDLDKPRAEVVIDVIVMEANRTRTRDLAAAIAYGSTAGIRTAINFTPRNPVLTGANTGTGTGTGGTTVPGIGTGTGTGTANPVSNLISLARVGRISSNDFSVTMPNALLNALLQDRETRVLQNPQVRTLDTTKVTLKIGDKYPYATGSFQPGIGAVGVSPLVSTQFQFADVGVNVDLTPKVHGADEVSMHIEIEISNIRDNIDVGGLRQPVIGTRRISEDVRLREGEVTLLGGLTTLNNSRVINGIPGLANLPGVGRLFGSESRDDSRSELLVALMPRIVRAPEISDVNMRGVAAGNDQTVKLSYAPREPKAPEIAGA
ncbi:MAG: type II and III secretion system protein, partial [Bryobacteraceae bacterium]|nr:type II and III secretion system protein [Bryobacteraceae bacterium]